MSILTAVILGMAFGFILQRAGALEYESILKTLRLMDLRIAKFMFTAVAVSAVGIFALRELNLLTLKLINFNLVGTLGGGLIFGVGFALSGYCPGTSIGAWAEGKKDAVYVIVGGLFGVLGYALVAGKLSTLLERYDYGRMMLGDLVSVNDFMLALIYSLAIAVIVYAANRIEKNIRK